jgi:hypothetical protein
MRTLVLALAFVGCAPEEEPSVFELLPPRQQLIRLSVDLRGVHPSEEELATMDAGDVLYDDYADLWIEDPRFVDRMKEVFNQRYLVRTGQTYYDGRERGVDLDRRVLADIVANEPLALLEHVIENDLPYSTMVTAEHSMANPALAALWQMDYPRDGEGWQPATYKDGRPHAGMLSMTTIWSRYPSMGGNANRHRANAISKMFLCDDYLSRPIVLNRAAVDELTLDPENAIRANSTCQSCHSTLDPLSATLFGFFTYDDEDGIARTTYLPENEEAWRYYAGKEPAYYGRPTTDLRDLGAQLATDQRFVDCAVETVFEGLTQREITHDDWSELAPHANTFAAEGQSIKKLVASIVKSEAYRAGAVHDEATAERIATVKLTSPAQLESIVEGITGFTWTFRGRRGLSTNDRGIPVLLGGIDSQFITERTYVPSVGGVFTQERLAQAAGYHVAQNDLSPGREGEARLLKFVTAEDTPESNPDAFRGQIHQLYLEITGVPLPADAVEPDQLIALWKYQHSVEADPIRAWGSVVSAVLRDPLVLFY